jgi:quinoprotein glucose dehydrogenase
MNTGRPGRAAAIVTAGGVVFVASTDDARFRALDATTGRELWVDVLERQGNANPMTYRGSDGRQYVAIAAIDALLAYRLP